MKTYSFHELSEDVCVKVVEQYVEDYNMIFDGELTYTQALEMIYERKNLRFTEDGKLVATANNKGDKSE